MGLSLLILAAGMGSRYGGLKQIDPLGAHGEIIIDYAIYDAWRAGFSQIVLVIRREHHSILREMFTRRYPTEIDAAIKIEYAFQDLDDLPNAFTVPAGREKPWGTGQAVYAARDLIKQPLAMINADDFYGAQSYQVIADYLRTASADHYCLAGYQLAQTLSDFGTVSRGVCEIDAQNYLVRSTEMTKIARAENGEIFNTTANNERQLLSGNEMVSMNLFGFTPSLFKHLTALFSEFLSTNITSPNSEFYIPYAINSLLAQKKATLKVLPTTAKWYGMTYRDDKTAIANGLVELTKRGVYPQKLLR